MVSSFLLSLVSSRCSLWCHSLCWSAVGLATGCSFVTLRFSMGSAVKDCACGQSFVSSGGPRPRFRFQLSIDAQIE